MQIVVESLEDLYRREFQSVVALAYVLSGSRTAAEELAQESFLAAHRAWDRISAYDDPAAWVRRVCANRSTSFLRRRICEAKALARLADRRVLPHEMPPTPPPSGARCGPFLDARPRWWRCAIWRTWPLRRSPRCWSAPKEL